jgi:hypothetical protein
MVEKMKAYRITLPDLIVKYLLKRFPTNEAIDGYIVSLIRADMDAPMRNTSSYRMYRKLILELHKTGKEISARTLAELGRCPRQVARDWLARFAKYKLVELVKRERSQRKIYQWIGSTSE